MEEKNGSRNNTQVQTTHIANRKQPFPPLRKTHTQLDAKCTPMVHRELVGQSTTKDYIRAGDTVTVTTVCSAKVRGRKSATTTKTLGEKRTPTGNRDHSVQCEGQKQKKNQQHTKRNPAVYSWEPVSCGQKTAAFTLV